MGEGTIIVGYRFPHPWPPENKIQILEHQLKSEEQCVASITAHTDGHLELEVMCEGRIAAEFHSLPVVVEGNGLVALAGRWCEGIVDIWINGEPLPSLEEDAQTFRIDTGNTESPEKALSLEHPDAKEKCESKINWRSKQYLRANKLSGPQDPRRFKSIAEQEKELTNAAQILKEEIVSVEEERKLYRMDVILALLRGLVCWDGYDPLLLRLAAVKQLPLPVWGFKTTGITEGPIPNFRYPGSLHLSLRREFSSQVLLDLQDWLDQPMLVDHHKNVTKKNRDIIREHASTSSIAHYLQHTMESVDRLRRTQSDGFEFLTLYILKLAKVVACLCKYTIEESSQN